jgi:hypothetical protein
MAQDHASLRAPPDLARRVVARTAQRSDAATSAGPPARSLPQRLGNSGTQALAARLVARSSGSPAAPATTQATDRLSMSSLGDAPVREAENGAGQLARMADLSPHADGLPPTGSLSGPVVQRRCRECEEESKRASGVESHPIQASLTVRKPGDAFEQEADRVAETVMRMPAPPSRAPAISSLSSATRAQSKESAAPSPLVTPEVEGNVRALQSEGSPLPPASREFFESRLGADFSQVRVNTGARAQETSKSLGARAFTVGQSISFGAGQYAPESNEGKHLLAHELTHVVQQESGVRRAGAPVQRSVSEGPHLQAAWYNFDIPFTDYQFDPSLEGIKTAATVVKDAAGEALKWIVDKIKSLVYAGIDWLRERWNAIQQFASSVWEAAKTAFANIIGFLISPLSFLADAILSFDPEALRRAWARFSGLLTTVANGFKAMTSGVLDQVNRIWRGISGFATSLLNRVVGMTDSFLFRKLPDTLQRIAFSVIDQLRRIWKSIDDGWTLVFNKIKAWIDGAIDVVFGFVRRVLSFGINVVIVGIIQFGQIILFLKDLFSNPKKYVEILASRALHAFDPVEAQFAGLVAKYCGGAKTPAATPGPTLALHRAPTAPEAKRSAGWDEICVGVAGMMIKKWDAFKEHPLAVISDLLMDMINPIVGDIKDIVQLFGDIKKIVTGPLSAGSLEELWTSLLKILDIPILVYRTVVSILMRTLMLPLIVASFIPHPLVKAIAAAVGYALLAGFVEAEMLSLGQKLLLLKTGVTTQAEKEDAYNRIADSLIALAMTAVIIVIMLILHFIASLLKGVYNFVKGKVLRIEPVPGEAKGGSMAGKGGTGEASTEGETPKATPDADLGFENSKRVLAEEPTTDGKHKIKVIEGGECLYCTSCGDLIKEYAIELSDPKSASILGELDAAEEISNPKIKAKRMTMIEEKLAKLRQENPHPIDPALAREARINLLGRDPAKAGKVTPGSLREAEVAVSLEEKGEVKGPIQRDPSGAADFIDGDGKHWDVKGFNSNMPPQQGGFDLSIDVKKVDDSLTLGENVMIDTKTMNANDVSALKAEGAKPTHSWGDRVIFYP